MLRLNANARIDKNVCLLLFIFFNALLIVWSHQ